MMIEKAEYAERITKLAASMRREDIDAVLLTGESNIDYFSGYRHHAPWTLFARPFFQIISADGRSVLLSHTFLEPEMRRTAAVADVRIFSRSGGAPTEEIRDILHDLGVHAGSLGMELGDEQRLGISLNDFRAVERCLPDIRIVDASRLLWRQRMIKSLAEIALIRRSCAVNAAAFAAAFAQARPGMSEQQIGRICAETMVHEGAERPGFILATSGRENHHILSGKPTARRLGKGDLLWIDMGAVVDGYWSDFCRAAYFGPTQPALEAGQRMILDVNAAMIEATRPGRTMRDIAAAAVAAFARQGIEITLGSGRIGHGMGLMSTEPPHVGLYDETVCEEGLVFTIEPRITNETGIFNCEEVLVVTKIGVEIMTCCPQAITYIH